jgi:hypothetical protein
MRIISQLVPNGKPVSTEIESTRMRDGSKWEIPAWGRPLALGVYPLFLRNEGRLVPAGTVFCICNLGISVTSLRNVIEAARRDGVACHADRGHAGSETIDIAMAVFHHQVLRDGTLSGNVWNLDVIQGASPTDVGYVFPQFQSGFPYLPLPMSFAIPKIGSRVICVGFDDLPVPRGGLSVNDIQSGRINLLHEYEHKFLAVEGRVSWTHTEGFSNGPIGGPCFSIDAEIKRGMRGGPVFSETGHVCGLIGGGGEASSGRPGTIVSLFYPALAANIRFSGYVGSVRINSNRRLIDLIRQGAVVTDGTENLLPAYEGSESFFPGPTSA